MYLLQPDDRTKKRDQVVAQAAHFQALHAQHEFSAAWSILHAGTREMPASGL